MVIEGHDMNAIERSLTQERLWAEIKGLKDALDQAVVHNVQEKNHEYWRMVQ